MHTWENAYRYMCVLENKEAEKRFANKLISLSIHYVDMSKCWEPKSYEKDLVLIPFHAGPKASQICNIHSIKHLQMRCVSINIHIPTCKKCTCQ